MDKREARPPGSRRRPGRPRKDHVASSVERASEYLRQTGRTDLDELRRVGSWALVEADLRNAGGSSPRDSRRKLLTAVARLRALLPPSLLDMDAFSFPLRALETMAKLDVYGDRRRHFAWSVLHHVAWAEGAPLSPMVLLALAVALGCEPPASGELRQAQRYDTWKKRHALVSRAVPGHAVVVLTKAMASPSFKGSSPSILRRTVPR